MQALAEAGALGSGMELDALAKASLKVLRSSPDLEKEIDSAKKLTKMDRDAPGKEWLSYWEENPINALAINNADTKAYFAVEGDRFICRLPIAPGAEAAFTALTKELIEYRLADYRDRPVRTVRPRSGAQEGGMEPIGGKLIRLPLPARLRTYPDLRAAARVLGRPDEAQDPDGQRTGDAWLPAKEEGAALFAVRASGTSMEGGKEPIRDGDWLVMRALAGAELGALEGKIGLLQVPDEKDGHAYWVKRVVRDADRWLLRSENPAVAPVPLREGTRPVAELLEVIRPEQLAPEVGTLLGGDGLDAAFLVPAAPVKTGRVGGHLFILVQDRALLSDSLRRPGVKPQEGETAFVLVKEEGGWRYLGVARRSEDGFALPGAGEG